jgi:hypothetical protein
MQCMDVVRIKRPEVPTRAVRVEKELWDDYAKACVAKGVSRNQDLRDHMLKEVRAHKRQQARDGTGSE